MSPRRKSVDSSSSSSSDSDSSSHKYGKVKKDKKDKKDKKHHSDHSQSHSAGASSFPRVNQDHNQFQSPPIVPPTFGDQSHKQTPMSHVNSPPPYASSASTPPSGYRIPLSTTSSFPAPQQTGTPPCYDADGVTPVFIGSALFETSVHPCKIGPHLNPAAYVPYGGTEHGHHGRYDLLPFIPEQMEFVRTSQGRIPPGRRPIEGGYEENGAKLYHAVGLINGVRVPGKTGEHLGACNAPFGGAEHIIRENYEILCWRN